ncbi:MAG: anthranilate phosphoribosyltransferase [Planctomycetes bacterium]|nr:anthranilate phosphoribosyltransferase [Planctomycetota bacterium]
MTEMLDIKQLEPLRYAVDRVRSGHTLTAKEIADAWRILMSGGAPDGLIGALLASLATRNPTGDELFGAASIMREFAQKVNLQGDHTMFLDTCGTGGAPKTFNVSTAAGIVLAACGVKIAKHGNRSRTGRGSAEVLESLGVNIHATEQQQQASFEKENICFCFAPNHHKAVASVMPVRKQLGFPTIFNLLGPLSNPCNAGRQLLGVWDDRFVMPMAESLLQSSTTKSAVVHSSDGLDEVSISAPTRMVLVENGKLVESVINPEELGLPLSKMEDVVASDLKQATAFVRDTLSGTLHGAVRDMVLVNVSVGLFLADRVPDLSVGIQMAKETVDSGRGAKTLSNWMDISFSL